MSTPVTLEALAAKVENLTRALELVAATAAPLVDVQVAADYLGVSTKTIRRLVADRVLPCRRIGRQLRFSLVQLAPIKTARA